MLWPVQKKVIVVPTRKTTHHWNSVRLAWLLNSWNALYCYFFWSRHYDTEILKRRTSIKTFLLPKTREKQFNENRLISDPRPSFSGVPQQSCLPTALSNNLKIKYLHISLEKMKLVKLQIPKTQLIKLFSFYNSVFRSAMYIQRTYLYAYVHTIAKRKNK